MATALLGDGPPAWHLATSAEAVDRGLVMRFCDEIYYHDIVPPPGIPRFNHAVPPLAHIVTGSGRSGPDDFPLPWRCAGVARPAERGAARRSRRDGHLSVRALRAIESATGNNLVGLIFARDRLNLKEFTAELAESRRTSTDQIRQRDDWQHGFWAACPRKGERVGSDVARGVSGSALLHA